MTDSIDLDDIDVQDDDEPEANPGDWLWKGDGDPETEPKAESDGLTGDDIDDRTPRVPRETDGRPVGIPTEQGGAGGGSGRAADAEGADGGGPAAGDATPGVPDGPDEGGSGSTPPEGAAVGVSGPVGSGDATSGPHGGDADDLTLAFTYRAMSELADPAAVVADARRWSDWIGLVGDVPVHVLNKFQREHVVDLDFFNGSGSRPTERLAGIGPSSMFYAERFVLVGLPDEAGMEPEGWEFRPLGEAAERAGWDRA
jgi:hypothetical protein